MSTARSIIAAAGLAAAAAATVAVVTTTSSAAAGTPSSGTFTVHAHHLSDTNVDLGKPGFSAGDQDVFVDRLGRDGQNVGWLAGSCTTVRVGRSSADQLCEFVLHLGTSQITSSGAVRAGQNGPGTFTVPILGGTGRYRGAVGQIAITAANGNSAVPITVSLG
jgi:hypothetical protein